MAYTQELITGFKRFALAGVLLLVCCQSGHCDIGSSKSHNVLSDAMLTRLVRFTVFPNDINPTISNLALCTMQQTGVLVTIEVELPYGSDNSISISDTSTKPLGEWLKLLHGQVPSLTWTVSDGAVHVLLSNGHSFSDPLAVHIDFSYSGDMTLDGWQQIIASHYPQYEFQFNGNGYRMASDDPLDTEESDRKFFCRIDKGITLRSYYTAIARSYGKCIWIIEYTDPQVNVPLYKATWVNFRKSRR